MTGSVSVIRFVGRKFITFLEPFGRASLDQRISLTRDDRKRCRFASVMFEKAQDGG
jgi:hypothetical protein